MLRKAAFAVIVSLVAASPASADAVKENIYVMGIHIGNAAGVLFGLTNSYYPEISRHPAAPALVRRQLVWTREAAIRLGLDPRSIVEMEKNLNGMSFFNMANSVDNIIYSLQLQLRQRYPRPSEPLFNLGVQVTAAQGVLRHIGNLLPRDKPPFRTNFTRYINSAAENITANRLEANVELVRAIQRQISDPFPTLGGMTDAAAISWQSEIGAAPAFAQPLGAPPLPQIPPPAKVQPISQTAISPSKTGSAHVSKPGQNGGGNTSNFRSSGGFSGKWSTNWGDMTLTQSGSSVSGTYSHSQGSLTGTVSGNVLRFHWNQKGNGNKGAGRFTLSGNTFSGSWSYTNDPDKGGNSWTGSRKK